MSRPRSPAATKGKPAGRSAPPARGAAAGRPAQRGVVVPQVESDIYTALLGVSFGSILIGCILLVVLWQGYEFALK